jgi:hypothetical protein
MTLTLTLTRDSFVNEKSVTVEENTLVVQEGMERVLASLYTDYAISAPDNDDNVTTEIPAVLECLLYHV